MSNIPKNNTIMIVEDSADDFEAISRAFKINTILNPVNHFVNGEDAMNFLFNNNTEDKLPALILLDLNMPKTDGRVFLRIIKQDERFINIPIIVLTTSLDDNDIDSVIINKQDSSYHIGDIEIYVNNINTIKAKQIIDNLENE